MKIRSLIVAVAFIIGSNSIPVYAANGNYLNQIDIDITVDENGDAKVREVWNATVDSGSEASRQLLNLNGSDIIDFKVTNEQGKEYILDSPWNSNDSRINKYTRCGTTEELNGDTTLYWGLGDYGDRAYILEYTITDYVKNCLDGQFIYSGLVAPNTRPYPAQTNIVITFPETVDISDSIVKHYGFQGYIDQNANILRISTDELTTNSSTYVTLLMKLDSNTLNCDLNFDRTFSSMVEVTDANGGTELDIQPPTIQEIIVKIAPFVCAFLLIFIIITSIRIKSRLKNELDLPVKVIFNKNNSIVKSVEDAEACSILDTELNQSIYNVWSIGLQYKIIQNEFSIINAFLMKWIINNNIEIHNKDNKISIDFVKEPLENLGKHSWKCDKHEISLYEMLIKAAISDQLDSLSSEFNKLKDKESELAISLNSKISSLKNSLESEEEVNLSDLSLRAEGLEHWYRDNHKEFTDWTADILLEQAELQTNHKMLVKIKESRILNKYMTFKEYKATKKLLDYANKIQGYKRYISTIYSKETNIHKDFDSDLVLAQLTGLTKAFMHQISQIECLSGYCREHTHKEVDIQILYINRITTLITHRVKTSKKSEQQSKLSKKLDAIKNKI